MKWMYYIQNTMNSNIKPSALIEFISLNYRESITEIRPLLAVGEMGASVVQANGLETNCFANIAVLFTLFININVFMPLDHYVGGLLSLDYACCFIILSYNILRIIGLTHQN